MWNSDDKIEGTVSFILSLKKYYYSFFKTKKFDKWDNFCETEGVCSIKLKSSLQGTEQSSYSHPGQKL